ncbi:MAG: hypothetical protein A3E31_10830 [Candidatus Rokubacteria bacterium RIFCSPHIGHO2_12_FULL_73_22]|nr:MAG: hypothetical protein A3D33_06640 [Candidatus Rokubacteria bacterium RIFCSPHIGHO2_02_FULL_73_26]OGL00425.1 MAG: hypothetical protein A3E31_10830 [Candidatus Rokubacteria bacterium RIFCSPHIGHO2_12_FULL_73_22]OGL13101.1 MAG: hypothetical protein A3I14_07950 [Candidatus Rokubacteria bacterium RIFCSPLOWO2_02_FULL_73_56]OGL28835.1 MAG: hypothetical protein A3G44_11360 [Candidatus Rokubacteria bacterium RIFCSPLOWO2_12_FULL_73_47]
METPSREEHVNLRSQHLVVAAILLACLTVAAAGAVVPEGLALLLVTVACVLTLGLLTTAPARRPVRGALDHERPGRGSTR